MFANPECGPRIGTKTITDVCRAIFLKERRSSSYKKQHSGCRCSSRVSRAASRPFQTRFSQWYLDRNAGRYVQVLVQNRSKMRVLTALVREHAENIDDYLASLEYSEVRNNAELMSWNEIHADIEMLFGKPHKPIEVNDSLT